MSDLPVGAHQSIAGGTPNAVARATATGCRVLQIFVKNSNMWRGKAISPEEARQFQEASRAAGLSAVIAHSSYLINAASDKEDLRQKSIGGLVDELSRCDLLGIPALVLHPGSRGEASVAEGVRRVAVTLDEALKQKETAAMILLETAAGQGAAVGRTFEELRDIVSATRHPRRLGICLDTCHVFAAGYELRTPEGYAETVSRFDTTIGLKNLHAIHVNDSKKDIGCHVDRHEHIGDGKIGEAGFRHLMTDRRLAAIPKFLETPKDEEGNFDRKNLATLRRLAA